MTNAELVNSLKVLMNFSNYKLPIRISYAIAKNINKLMDEYKIYEGELNKLQDEYGGEGDEFTKALNELLNMEIQVELYKLEESDFMFDDPSSKFDALTASDIILLRSVL